VSFIYRYKFLPGHAVQFQVADNYSLDFFEPGSSNAMKLCLRRHRPRVRFVRCLRALLCFE